MSKYVDSVGSKLDWTQKQRWTWLCEFRGIKSAEYLRRLIMDEIDKYSHDRDFKRWVEAKERERKEEK